MVNLDNLIKGELTPEHEGEFLKQCIVMGRGMYSQDAEAGFYTGLILALVTLKRKDLAYKLEAMANQDQQPITIN